MALRFILLASLGALQGGCKAEPAPREVPVPVETAEDAGSDEIAKATAILRNAEKSLGPDRVELISDLYALAKLHAAQGDLEQVAVMYLQAAKIGANSHPAKMARYKETLENLTHTYLELRRFSEAVPFFNHWVDLQRGADNALSPKHYLFVKPLADVAHQYARAGSYDFAAKYHQRVMAHMREPLRDPQARYHHMLVENIAAFYLKHQKYQIAKRTFLRVLPVAKDRHYVLRSLAKIYSELGNQVQARTYELAAKQIAR